MKTLRYMLYAAMLASLSLVSCTTAEPEPAPEQPAPAEGTDGLGEATPAEPGEGAEGAPAPEEGADTAATLEAEVKDYTFFLARLSDLDRLAVPDEGVKTAQFSSYDRKSRYDETTGKYQDWDANADAGNYLRVDPETGEAVLAEMDGPGCI